MAAEPSGEALPRVPAPAGTGLIDRAGALLRPRTLLFGTSLIALMLIALPLVYLLVRAAGAGPEAWDRLLDARTGWVMVRSIGLAAAVAAGAVAIAVPYAWLTVRSDLPLRRLWLVLGCLPLVIPSYVGALALIGALGPRGMLQQLLEPLGVERLPAIYGFGGAWAALVLFTYPYVLLIVAGAYARTDASLERAARSMGLGPLQAFVRVTLPQLRSSIVAGALLCALYTLGDFGVVSFMRFNTFTREIFIHYRSLYDREGAALLSLLLCLITLVVLFVERRTLRGRPEAGRRRVQAREQAPAQLGSWRVPGLLFCGVVVTAALLLPMAVLLWWAATPGANASLPEMVLAAREAAVGSLVGSSLAAGAAVLLAVPIALLVVRFPSRSSSVVEAATYTGFALPGIVAALGMVFFATRYAPALYQTLALLVAVYVMRFLPQAVGAARTSLERVNPRLESAARGMGYSGLATFQRVTLPLAGPGIVAGGMLVFLTAMKELPATLILRPTGFDTLATLIWQKAAVSAYSAAAVPALALILVSALPLYLLVIRPVVATAEGRRDES